MAASRSTTVLLASLLVVSVVAASVGAATATPDDSLDDGTDGNLTDTTDTTDTVENTTDTDDTDTAENTTDTDDTTDTTDTSDADTFENTTDTTNTTDADTVDNTTDTTTETTNATGDTIENTTNTTGATVENTTNTVGATVENTTNATGMLDDPTSTLDGATEALSGTLTATTDATVNGLLETTATTVLETDSDAGGAKSANSESAGDATRRESGDWTRQQRSASGGVVQADTASVRGEPASRTSPDETPRHLPLPDGAAATTALVAGLVAIARPPVVTRGGAQQVGSLAAKGATAGFDRLRRFLVPLRYSRYDDSDPLDHETRAALYEAIETQPGVYLSDLCERADVNISTARHHVRVLEDEGLVTSVKPRGKRRYYPGAADDHELAAALSEPATAAVLEALADVGPAHVGVLADELDRDPSTVSHHLQRLADDGLVVRERDGRAVVNRLADPVADAVAGSHSPEPAVADD